MTAAANIAAPAYIEATPDVCAGRPRIAGSRIKVSQVAAEYEHLGMTPAEIVESHPHLTLASVHAALAYFYDHRDAIIAEWREAEDVIARMRAKFPPTSDPPRPNR